MFVSSWKIRAKLAWTTLSRALGKARAQDSSLIEDCAACSLRVVLTVATFFLAPILQLTIAPVIDEAFMPTAQTMNLADNSIHDGSGVLSASQLLNVCVGEL